jgi:hypothetical protein
MPGKSQSYSDAVLNVLRGTSITGVSPYLGLFSVAPADDSSAGTELAGNGYARQAITFAAPVTDTGNPPEDRQHEQHSVRPRRRRLAPGRRIRGLRRPEQWESPVLEHARDAQDHPAGRLRPVCSRISDRRGRLNMPDNIRLLQVWAQASPPIRTRLPALTISASS